MGFLITQWNCRGLLHNIDDIKYFLNDLKCTALCLQETYLNKTHTNILRNYHVFRRDRSDSSHSGGVAVVVQRNVACSQIRLSTSLEAAAVRIILDRAITLCSLYIPPNTYFNLRDLHTLILQLPPPFLLLGDFNAHHPLWGCAHADSRGSAVERILLSSNLCLLNDKEPTFFSATHRTFTSIDLSIASPALANCFEWKVSNNPLGSDHFPIFIRSTSVVPSHRTRSPR